MGVAGVLVSSSHLGVHTIQVESELDERLTCNTTFGPVHQIREVREVVILLAMGHMAISIRASQPSG